VRLHRDAAFPTGRLIGWNLGRGTLYGPPGHRWRTPLRERAIDTLKRIRAPHVRPWMRFSGLQIDGSFGNDGYHFERVVENMEPAEYLGLMEEADAEPIVTLNFATGTAEEAARYAAHVATRGVTQFEIGNECYGIWNTGYNAEAPGYAATDPAWRGRPSSDVADFGARALAYVEAVVAVVPAAKFFVPLSQASMDAWGGVESSVPALAPLLAHPAVNGVVVHQYHVDEAMMFGLADKNDATFILAGSERYRREYDQLRAALPAGMGIAITEYQVAGAFARGQYRWGDDALSGLGIADMLIAYAQLGIEDVCQHLSLGFEEGADAERDILVEPWYLPLFADGTPRPSVLVTSLIADHLRAKTVPVELDGPSMSLTIGDETLTVPRLHAVAFASEEDTTIVVLNRGDEARIAAPARAVRSYGADAMVEGGAQDRITLGARTVTGITLA
jgi:hypothetical protein